MARVCIISGTGWLGHRIVHKIAERGHQVVVVSRQESRAYLSGLPADVKFLKADRHECADFEHVLYGITADVVIDVTPWLGAETESIVRAFQGRISHYIHCSSTGIYTPHSCLPATEEHECVPHLEYGGFEHKIEVDEIVQKHFRKEGFPATILRPTNIMGPGKLPIDVWGGRHPDFLPRLLDGKPIIIPNDGRALLQPVFLDDLAEAFSLAMEQPHNSIGQVFNISSRYAITLSHYIEILRHELRSTSTVEYVPMEYIIRLFSGTPYLDVPGLRFICEHMCVDCKKADRVLGYRPTMTAEEAIRHTLKWFHETGNQKKVPALGSDRKSSPSG